MAHPPPTRPESPRVLVFASLVAELSIDASAADHVTRAVRTALARSRHARDLRIPSPARPTSQWRPERANEYETERGDLLEIVSLAAGWVRS